MPADPQRLTAKPVCRLIVPPLQRYTDELLIGVYAGANNNGSMLETMGLAKVVCHYEGTRLEILTPSYQTITDANGVQRSYFGWWIKLAHDGRHGRARVYFEAVPRDVTMQSRVIGPYEFAPQAQVHDWAVTIAASLPVIAGERYQTLRAAFDYLKSKNAVSPLITFIESGRYLLRGPTTSWIKNDGGRITVTATAPVTLVKDPADPNLYFRPLCEPLCYRGSNISIDFAEALEYYFEIGTASPNWFDGCRLICSGGPRSLYKKGLRMVTAQVVRGLNQTNWFTEVEWSDLPNAANYSALVRGGSVVRGFGDIIDNCAAVIGFAASENDSQWYRTPVAAMTARYLGGGAAARLEASGSAPKTLTARVDGVAVGTYQLVSTFANHDTDTNYHVHNVVDWLNGKVPGTTGGTLAGWSATLLDDSRAAYALYQGAGAAVPGATGWSLDCKAGAVTLYTAWDIHADLAQTANLENVVLVDSANIRCATIQNVYFAGGPSRDALILNNVFDTEAGDFSQSQFTDIHSHVVCAHNSWSRQAFALRTDLGATGTSKRYDPDPYCLFACNAIPAVRWLGPPSDKLAMRDNHLFAGAAVPAGATGTSVAGTVAELFADPANGDFTPRGALLDHLKSPVVRFDRQRKARHAAAPAGAQA